MAHKQYGSATGADLPELLEAFLLKLSITNGQDLVDQQDLGLHVRRDGKCQAHVHAGGVALDWSIDKFLHFGEGYDFIELSRYLSSPHAEDSAIQKDVVAPRQF